MENIEYFIDFIGKKVHLMDNSTSYVHSLVNEISPDFQKNFLDQQVFTDDLLKFEWIIYGSDGLISAYSNYNFKILNPKLPYLHEPFVETSRIRRNKRYGH